LDAIRGVRAGDIMRSGSVKPFKVAAFVLSVIGTCLGSLPALAADGALIAAAKREGEVTWYTTLIVDQLARPISAAFEKKYGIKVNFVRSGDAEVSLRLYNESRAGNVQGDIFDATNGSAGLKKLGMLLQWHPDPAARFPKEYVDPDGYWTPMSLYVLEPGYNTNLVAKEDVPHTFQDLLDPKWKGKLAWNSDPGATGAQGFIGAALTAMGEEKGLVYLKQLAAQNVVGVPGGARHLFDMVIAGEYPMALQMLNHHAFFSAGQGAPAGWAPVQDAMAFFIVLDLVKNSPHPNAGKLLEDFIVSPDGQAIFRDIGYIPVDPDMAPRDPSLKPDGVRLRVNYFMPQQIDAGLPKWESLFRDIFR
jgi:iron(III) transport system substrate-binding protein